LIELAAFNELHAEITGAIALTDFMNWDDAWVLQAGGRFGFATETFHMRFAGPMAQPDHFERHGAVETFLSRAIDHALTTATDFFLDFVITKVSKHSSLSRPFLSIPRLCSTVAAGNDRGYRVAYD
jgi:hypothetical protein